jgi:hypothetical protein
MPEQQQDFPESEFSAQPGSLSRAVLVSSTFPASSWEPSVQYVIQEALKESGFIARYEGDFNSSFRGLEPQPRRKAWEEAGMVLLLVTNQAETARNFQSVVDQRVKENRPLLLFALEKGDWGRVFPQVPADNFLPQGGRSFQEASEDERKAVLADLARRVGELIPEARLSPSQEEPVQKTAQQAQPAQPSFVQEMETEPEESKQPPAGERAAEPVPDVAEPYRTQYPQFQDQLGRFSKFARNIYYFACTLAQTNPDGGPVAPIHLLFAFHLAGRRSKSSTAKPIKAEIDKLSADQYRDLYRLGMPEDPRKLNKTWGQLPGTAGNHTPAVQRAFDQADEIARAVNRRREIRTRYLVTSFLALTPADDPARRFLEDAGVDWEELRWAVKQTLVDKGEDLNFPAWSKVLDAPAAGPEAAEEVVFSHAWLSGFNADVYRGKVLDDLLDIRRDVRAFAYLIAAKISPPPLSIGLFGEWGSGKTYFMQLLKKEVEQICADMRKARKKDANGRERSLMQKEAKFYKHIVQIEFNAWQYMEGNLWASLVEHIFRNLYEAETRPVSDEEKSAAALRLQKLQEKYLKDLGVTQMAAEEAERRAKEALDQLEQAEVDLEEARQRYQETAESLTKLSFTNVVETVFSLGEVRDEINQVREAINLKVVGPYQKLASEEIQPRLAQLYEALEIPESGERVDALYEKLKEPEMEARLEELRAENVLDQEIWDLIQQIRNPTRSSVEEFQAGFSEARVVVERGNPLLTSLARNPNSIWLLLGALAVALGLSLSLGWLLIRIDPLFGQNAGLLSTVASFVASGAIWVKKQSAWWSDRLAQVERVKEAIDTRVSTKQAEIQQQITELEKQLELRKEAYIAKEQAKNIAQQRVDEIKVQIAEATPQKMLEKFIQERTESSDYRKHLGLLALIRQDFQNLSELIELENERLEGLEDLTEEEKDDDQRINRVVLYIDDLDRCPTEKVVQVMQAVHLLLAFPLFVVVVAVDARWISNSLKSKYGSLLRGSRVRRGTLLSTEPYGSATPLDYIEKIFQIPFWLRPIDEKGRRSLIRGLLKDNIRAESIIAAAVPAAPSTEREIEAAPTEIEAESTDGQIPTQVSELVDQGEQTGPEIPPPGSRDEATIERISREGGIHASVPLTDPDPEGLSIPHAEVEYMERLLPLLGRSPRAVKRFVNIYRIIRVSLTEEELSSFTAGDYRVAMFLLAVVTNLPAASELVFSTFEDASISKLETWESLVRRLNSQPGAQRNVEWPRVHAWLQQPGGLDTLPFDVALLQLWAKRIGRFSFFIEPRWLD